MHPSILSKHKNKCQNLFNLWTTTAIGGRSSLPTPRERSDSDFSGPPSLLWSPWMELGATNQILVFNSVLTQNYQSVLSSQIAVIKKSSYCSNPLKTLPYCFSLFPQWNSWITFTWMHSLRKITEQPQLSSLSTFKRLPRYFFGLTVI